MWGYVMSFVMIKCFNNIGWRDHSSQQQWAAQKELILTTPVLISPRQSPAAGWVLPHNHTQITPSTAI